MGYATGKMVGFMRAMVRERDLPDDLKTTMISVLRDHDQGRPVSFRTADGLIRQAKPCPRIGTPARPAAPRVRPGCFIMDGRIWVVNERVDKRGVYAMLLVESADRIRDEDGERVPFELKYDRDMSLRALGGLTEDHRMSFATARDYVVRYGRCFAPRGRGVCGITLKAADSVELGIGPVCGKFFPGYDQAVVELRAGRKHALYEQARDELGIALTDVQLYRLGAGLSTVAGIERKLDLTPANA